MQEDGRLTAGRLITYQLYWNMMNSAYQSLVDIVNTFTRAGIVNMYMNAQRSACAPNPYELLVSAAFSYKCMRPSATRV